jgi:hypothetical protein
MAARRTEMIVSARAYRPDAICLMYFTGLSIPPLPLRRSRQKQLPPSFLIAQIYRVFWIFGHIPTLAWWWNTITFIVVDMRRCFGETCRPNCLISVTLKVKAASSFETSGCFRKILQPHITEDRYTIVRIWKPRSVKGNFDCCIRIYCCQRFFTNWCTVG